MPFAIDMPPPQVIILGIVLGSMIVGWILDRIARAAGVRRFKGWDYMAAVICAGVGGYFGMIDGDERSIGVGAAVGFIAGAMVASVVFGALATVISFFTGPPIKEGEEDKPRKVTIVRRFAILIFGALPVAFAALVAHEVYWLANLGAVTLQYNVGYKMLDYTQRDEPMEKLAETLADNRWQVESASIRPAEWLIHPDYVESNAEVLAYLKMFSGDKPTEEFPEAWNKQDPLDLVMFAQWSTPNFAPKDIPTEPTQSIGVRIGKKRFELFNEILDRTLALRYLPRDLFVRGVKEVKRKGQPGDNE